MLLFCISFSVEHKDIIKRSVGPYILSLLSLWCISTLDKRVVFPKYLIIKMTSFWTHFQEIKLLLLFGFPEEIKTFTYVSFSLKLDTTSAETS